MTNAKLKEIITDMLMDDEDLYRIVFLEGDEFANGCVGITSDNRLVYSYEKLVQSLTDVYIKDGETVEEARRLAIDSLYYNTIASIANWEQDGNLIAPVVVYAIPGLEGEQ